MNLVEVTVWGPGQEIMGDGPVLSHCSLLRNPWLKPTGVLSIVVKEKPAVSSPFFEAFHSDRIPKATKDVHMYISLFRVLILVNYTNEFREHFGATTHIRMYCLFIRPIDKQSVNS